MGFRKPISKVFLGGDRPRQIGVVHGSAGGHKNARRTEVDEKNAALKKQVHALDTILAVGIARDAHVAVGDWRREPTQADLPDELNDRPHPEPENFDPPPLGLLERLIPGAAARHAAAAIEAKQLYEAAVTEWDEQKARQADALAALETEIREHNHRLAELEALLKAGDAETVRWYAHKVLSQSPYPRRIPRKIEVVFDAPKRTIKVRIGIPGRPELIPSMAAYRYNKPVDEITEVERPEEDSEVIYHRVVAQIALRTLHEVFSTDLGGCIDTIALSLDAALLDPSTGHETTSPVLELKVARSAFAEIDLTKVAPIPCLQRLRRAALPDNSTD
jgi:restriction system protein